MNSEKLDKQRKDLRVSQRVENHEFWSLTDLSDPDSSQLFSNIATYISL